MITACLVSWRRKYHVPTICDHLLRFPEISEIIIWQNESDMNMPELPPGVQVINCDANEYVFGRFLAAEVANNETVFFQDDDLLVNNFPALLGKFKENDEEVIIANLAQDKSSRHWSQWQSARPPWVEVGFGSIAPRWAIEVLGKWPHSHELLQRKADKIFTIMNDWQAVRAGPSDITRLFYRGKESGRDRNSLWLREDHKPLNREAVRLATEWREEFYGKGCG